MRKISIFILAASAIVASAQNKIDFAGRSVIERVRELQSETEASAGENTKLLNAAALSAVEQTYNVIVEFVDNNIDLGWVGVELISYIGNMAVVSATAQEMEQLADLPQVVAITLGFEKNAEMYLARPACGVDAVQAGTDGLNRAYTGRGVVTGLFDVGLDVNHINFLTAAGEPRTKALWTYGTPSSGVNSGKETAYTTASQILGFTTENKSETHGTHVLGIMSGSYSGPARYTVIGDDGKAKLIEQDAAGSSIPFYGVATEADLAVSCGPLYDGNISAGVQRIVEYAESTGQPCVVNLSIGSTIGPHDGTDAITKYLSLLGEKAIICIAAGNDGDTDLSISVKGKTVKTFATPDKAGDGGTVQFWSSDDKPFKLSFIAYDKSKEKAVFTYTLSENLGGKSVKQNAMPGFSSYLSGSAELTSNVSTTNNRYSVTAKLNVSSASSSVIAGFIIEPLDGQTVDGYANNMTFTSQSVPGFTRGNPNNSISSMACGDNVIVVGAFTTAPVWACFTSKGAGLQTYQNKPTLGAISAFSSYGTTFSGRQLPDICGPGQAIISSYSQYYMDATAASKTDGWMTGLYTAPKGLLSRNSQWGVMQGTSMACPFVAGVVATWLEADPTLSIGDVRSIIDKTAMTDFDTMANRKRFGAGKIDALAGIKEVLSQTGISEVMSDRSEVFVNTSDNRNFEIFVSGASTLKAGAYSLAGAQVAAVTADGQDTVLSLEGAQPGVYVLRIQAENVTATRKIVVR